MEMRRIELLTPCLQGSVLMASPFKSFGFESQLSSSSLQNGSIGGDEENRTPDPLLARQVLSQLSYTPGYSLFLGIVPSKLNNTAFSHRDLTVFDRCSHRSSSSLERR